MATNQLSIYLYIWYSRYMDRMSAIAMLGALGQSTRLEAFELLMKSEPNGLPAGDVARRLGILQNTMSAHLATLSRAGLIRAERQGRKVIYRAEPNQLLALATFLNRNSAAAGSSSSRTETEGAGR